MSDSRQREWRFYLDDMTGFTLFYFWNFRYSLNYSQGQ